MRSIGSIPIPDFPLLLARMEDVSDTPFRLVCKMNGADLMNTEFFSREGLKGNAFKSRQKLDIFEGGKIGGHSNIRVVFLPDRNPRVNLPYNSYD